MTPLDTLRDDVALANRILERTGLSHAFGHASARLPGTEKFLLPRRRSPGFAQADQLLEIDGDGNVTGDGTPNSEFWIHARIYAQRPDIGGVVHAHPAGCVCLTQIGAPHRVVHNQGGPFHGRVAVFDKIGLIRSRALGDELASALDGGNIAAMMRGHGITTACADVRTAVVAALFLEESATLQLRMLAAAGGDASRLREFTLDEAKRLDDQLGPAIVERAWDYYASLASS